jgi:3-methyladenine DNA glycosylase/8-oxoguanine DNA glycosylase
MMMPMKTHLEIAVSGPFDFANAAYSHGWVVLAPNAWDPTRETLSRVEELASGKVVSLVVSGHGSPHSTAIHVDVESPIRLGQGDRDELLTNVGQMFRANEDLQDFYKACRKRGGRWRKLTRGLGRLLCSPTVFEDVVKTICTTNIQWGGTKSMVAGLVNMYGRPMPNQPQRRAFPKPGMIAARSKDAFIESVRMGYRAPYVHELATRVAAGKLDLEALRDPEMSTSQVKKQLLAIKGVGNYAAATLLMLLGHYDELAIDTVCRDFVTKKYFDGTPPTDDQIHEIYAPWGRWKYLAYWFDLWTGLAEKL